MELQPAPNRSLRHRHRPGRLRWQSSEYQNIIDGLFRPYSPALTNLNGSSQSSPPRPFYQPQTTSFILSQFYQQAQQQAQQQQQQQQQQQGTLSPQALHPSSFYASPPASREPTPQERKAKLFKELVPLLDSKAFTGAQAVQNLVQVIQEYGAQDVGVETRQTILSKMRDHAPNHYFRAWTENPAAMDMLRDWLKAGVAGKNDGDTIMPLLHVSCTTKESKRDH